MTTRTPGRATAGEPGEAPPASAGEGMGTRGDTTVQPVQTRIPGLSPPRGLTEERARDLMARLNRDGARIAAQFDLTYRAIVAERRGVHGHFGVCYDDGLIKIRLQHATRGTPLKYSSLINTLCHELAHLRHFDHGEDFQRLYEDLLAWARRQAIYRPASRSPAAGPGEECGLDPAARSRILAAMREAVSRARRHPPGPARGSQLLLFPG